MDETIAYYVQQLYDNDENAYFSLLEIDESLLDDLKIAYSYVSEAYVRRQIIEVIGERRRIKDILFLADVLKSNKEELWKSALDALVKIGLAECIVVLNEAKSHSQNPNRLEWYDEAVQQIEERLHNKF